MGAVPELHTYIIAEIGVNHNGSVDLAKQLINEAKECDADAVKFQTFRAESLVSPNTLKVAYQRETTSEAESHYEMIRKLELGYKEHEILFDYCRKSNIDFISTPYDIKSAKFLNELGVSTYKTASADIVDLPLHEYLAATNKNVIIATGMATLGEVDEALSLYEDKTNIALLHCVSNYPCSKESLNLRAMTTLKNTFNVQVGFSDHSIGPHAASLAVALGASIVERHFTLDKTLPGPDHKASSTPAEFRDYINYIRAAETALGSSRKQCQEEEAQMASVSRKSIVLRHGLKEGHVMTKDDLTLKRPGTGLYAREMKNILNRRVRTDLAKDHILSYFDLE